MSQFETDRARNEQRWLSDAAALKAGWFWWAVLVLNMVVFAWGLRRNDAPLWIPLSCVWLGAFSCCTIFHLESVKRTLVLKAEIDELRRALTKLAAPRDELV